MLLEDERQGSRPLGLSPNASGAELSNVGLPPVTTNTAFTTLALNNQIAPANATSVRFRISCDAIDNGDSITYYVDNAQLTFSGGTAGVYYILADHLGGAYKIVDANGANAQTSVYYAFGESRSNPSGLRTDKLYTGQQLEPSSGLYQMGARWYDPIIGRWLNPDSTIPISTNPQDWNRYSFNRNNPLRYKDPSGNDPEDVVKFVCNVVIGAWEGVRDNVAATVNMASYMVYPRSAEPSPSMKLGASLVADPGGTAQAVGESIAKPYADALEEGQPGKAIGRGLAEVGIILLGTKGSSALSKAGKTGEVAEAASKIKIPSAEELVLSKKVESHLNDLVTKGPYKGEQARPFTNSKLLVQEIMESGNPGLDPQGVEGCIAWNVEGSFRGATGTWELVVDTKTNTVVHLNFTAKK